MPKADELSPVMRQAADVMREHGGELVRRPGGFWTWPDCPKGRFGEAPEWHVGTPTVRALIARGAVEVVETLPRGDACRVRLPVRSG